MKKFLATDQLQKFIFGCVWLASLCNAASLNAQQWVKVVDANKNNSIVVESLDGSGQFLIPKFRQGGEAAYYKRRIEDVTVIGMNDSGHLIGQRIWGTPARAYLPLPEADTDALITSADWTNLPLASFSGSTQNVIVTRLLDINNQNHVIGSGYRPINDEEEYLPYKNYIWEGIADGSERLYELNPGTTQVSSSCISSPGRALFAERISDRINVPSVHAFNEATEFVDNPLESFDIRGKFIVTGTCVSAESGYTYPIVWIIDPSELQAPTPGPNRKIVGTLQMLPLPTPDINFLQVASSRLFVNDSGQIFASGFTSTGSLPFFWERRYSNGAWSWRSQVLTSPNDQVSNLDNDPDPTNGIQQNIAITGINNVGNVAGTITFYNPEGRRVRKPVLYYDGIGWTFPDLLFDNSTHNFEEVRMITDGGLAVLTHRDPITQLTNDLLLQSSTYNISEATDSAILPTLDSQDKGTEVSSGMKFKLFDKNTSCMLGVGGLVEPEAGNALRDKGFSVFWNNHSNIPFNSYAPNSYVKLLNPLVTFANGASGRASSSLLYNFAGRCASDGNSEIRIGYGTSLIPSGKLGLFHDPDFDWALTANEQVASVYDSRVAENEVYSLRGLTRPNSGYHMREARQRIPPNADYPCGAVKGIGYKWDYTPGVYYWEMDGDAPRQYNLVLTPPGDTLESCLPTNTVLGP